MDLYCPSHYGSLQSTRILSKCNACYEDYHANNQGYKCTKCEFCLHEVCINVYISSRHKHPLKLSYYRYYCDLCECYCGKLHYKCLQCTFGICIPCTRKPLTFTQIKVHEHELRQIPIKMSFTCDACGVCEPNFPCVCLQCCFKIHRKCISLPRVISINCHDHRISHVLSLGPGKRICGVCYKNVDGAYGAYSCLVCSDVFHSKCATDINIWDGTDLEGVPEEEEESKPFEVIDQNLIKHFSHEHNLKALLLSSRLEEPSERCYACTLPFYSDLCYKCTQCSFILHNSCANHPLKKKNMMDTKNLILVTPSLNDFGDMFKCSSCYRYCNGFSYLSKHYTWKIDVRCASMSGRLIEHESHPHSLFAMFSYKDLQRCEGCKSTYYTYLYCTNRDNCGGYCLCFRCATLPTKLIRPKYDDHPLCLCYNENNVDMIYCCEVCEEQTSSKKWFYKCNECGSTFHIKCVFQNLIHLLPGYKPVTLSMGSFNLLQNNRVSRPICFKCKIHCMDDFVLCSMDKSIFICISCATIPYRSIDIFPK